MTAEETAKETAKEIPQEPGQFLALLEKVEKEQRVLAEAHGGHVERLDEIERRFEKRFDAVEAEIRRLDVKVGQKLGALDAKVDARFDALAIGIERIATHLGLGSVIPSVPTGPPASA